MKSVNAAVSNAIRNDYAVYAQPKLTAEWNMNRYFDTTVDNYPSEDTNGYDIEMFPIESIVAPTRPTKGILIARTDEALVTDLDKIGESRFYLGSDANVYRYWTSPTATNGSKQFTTTVQPHVFYAQQVAVNKIVVKIENFWASPDVFYIKTTPSTNDVTGPVWTTVATSPTIDNKGQVTLYWNGTSWSSTKPANLTNPPLTTIGGLMIDVRSMKAGVDTLGVTSTYRDPVVGSNVNTTGVNSFFNLIELSARRTVDISNYLMNVSDEFDMGEASDLYPIGTLTSNGGTVTLSNIYTQGGVTSSGYFNNLNSASPYYGLIEPNVEFNLEYVYTIGSSTYSVQQFKLYSGEWSGQKGEEVSVPLHDASAYLEMLTPAPALYENLTVPQIFQRVLDSVGFVDWVLDEDDRNETHTIPIFYIKGDKNTWEILNDLAQGTQTAIYFDSYGQMQVKTRYAAYDDTKSPTWTFRGQNDAGGLADIIEYSEDGEVGTNSFTITYKNTSWDEWNNNSPNMQKVWEPDSDVVLSSSPLIYDCLKTDNVFWISPSNVVYWPYEGLAQIDGEIIKYRGKHFIYYTGSSGQIQNQTFVASQGEYNTFNELTPTIYRSKNYFSGALAVDIDEDGARTRGYWNSDPRNHYVNLQNYDVRKITYTSGTFNVSNVQNNASGLRQDKANSIAQLRSSNTSGQDLLVATIGNSSDTGWGYAGTKLRFNKDNSQTDQQAGIVINYSGTQDGYYLDLRAKTNAPTHKGISLYSVKGGNYYPILTTAFYPVVGVWYEIDLVLTEQAGGHFIKVFVDGKIVMSAAIANSDPKYNAKGGKFGFFKRGRTSADFEYLYGIGRPEADPQDDSTFFDLIHGGYAGGQWAREWVHGWKTKKKRKKKKWTKETVKWNNYFFDEFGPYVHEMREFDVNFDPAPAQISRLYMTNDWATICTEFRSSPFGAHFVLANVSRTNAVANGDDTSIFGLNNIVNQVLTVIGRVLVYSDEETVVVKNTDSIRTRGEIQTEISSDWIQSKSMAEDISNWMNSHWSNGLDTISLSVFGNPLIEIGDVVAIQYDQKYITAATHKYFVTGINSSFETGLTTDLTLRRVN